MFPRALLAIVFLLAAAWPGAEAMAQTQKPQRPFKTVVAEWTATLERAAQELSAPSLSAARATTLRKKLAAVKAEARAIEKNAAELIRPLRARAEALGPPPEEDAAPEPEEIAKQRRGIGEDIAFYDARIKQAELTIARVEELLAVISEKALKRQIETLLTPHPFPLAPDVAAAAAPEFLQIFATVARSPLDWWQGLGPEQRERIVFYRFAVVLVLALGIGWAVRWALLHWFGRDPGIENPTYTRRLAGGIAEGIAYGIVPALIFGGLLYRVTSDAAIISGFFAQVAATFLGVMIFFTLAWAMPRAVLAPDLPAWRLVPLAPENARAINRRIAFLAGVYAIDLFLRLSSRSLVLSDELVSLYNLVVNTLLAVGVLALVRGQLWLSDEARAALARGAAAPAGGRLWPGIRALIGVIALAVIVSALAGYANLSGYLKENLLLSGVVVGALFLLRGLCRELIGAALRSTYAQSKLAMPHKSRNRFKFWFRALLDAAIFAIGILLLLLLWGVAPEDMWLWIDRALLGFTIGNVTISITDIFAALAVFAVAMVVTRMIQRVLSERVFPQTTLDTGVQHSLSTGVGYLGLAAAAALGISTLGLDLSNVALIAGALSVGIGFGLQNVVNNFVSGLILLIERPIKVGDWIVVGGFEGYVKRINVRATEIQTFQRASVIVPNSELISGAVTNWTHKDRHGRVEVPVGVAYGSDVGQVMEIPTSCLRDHEDILAEPEPYVLFQGFGDSSLDFDARGYIANVEYRVVVASELRVAINRAFAAAGIDIPFPQRDIHIKSADQRETALAAAPAAPEPTAEDAAARRAIKADSGEGES